jgi:hypothetical protein
MTGLLQTLAVGVLVWLVVQVAINYLSGGDDDGEW